MTPQQQQQLQQLMAIIRRDLHLYTAQQCRRIQRLLRRMARLLRRQLRAERRAQRAQRALRIAKAGG